MERYGERAGDLMDNENDCCPSNSSRWWKDIVNLEGCGGPSWFNEEVARKVRNGVNTKFWYARWRGGVPFRGKYPRLFSMSNQKEAMVANMGVNNGPVVEWRFFVWEEQLLNNLLEDLEGHVWTHGEDVWVWKLEDDGNFTVKSMYGEA